MILLLDTSTSACKIVLIDGDSRSEHEWEAGRQLSRGLLKWLEDKLEDERKTWQDLKGLGVFCGPGSFTGLRIGLTVMNTLSDSLNIPIVGVRGDNWKDEALDYLGKGQNDRIALPFYGSDAHITTPRK